MSDSDCEQNKDCLMGWYGWRWLGMCRLKRNWTGRLHLGALLNSVRSGTIRAATSTGLPESGLSVLPKLSIFWLITGTYVCTSKRQWKLMLHGIFAMSDLECNGSDKTLSIHMPVFCPNSLSHRCWLIRSWGVYMRALKSKLASKHLRKQTRDRKRKRNFCHRSYQAESTAFAKCNMRWIDKLFISE